MKAPEGAHKAAPLPDTSKRVGGNAPHLVQRSAVPGSCFAIVT